MRWNFEVPFHLAKGYANGDNYLRGVKLHDRVTGNIVGHLVRVGDGSQKQMQRLLSSAAQTLQFLVPALQVVNLAVPVVGFAVIASKLNSVSRQVGDLDARLALAHGDVVLTRQISEAGLTALLLIGVEEAARGERLAENGINDAARRQIHQAYVHHLALLPMMLRDGNAAAQLERAACFVRRTVLLAVAVARCDWIRGGAAQASRTIGSARQQIEASLFGFETAFRSRLDFAEEMYARCLVPAFDGADLR